MNLFCPRTALVLAALLTPASLQAQGEAACARDVLVAGSMQRQAIEQLEGGGEDEASLCRVWRRHIETMRRIAGASAAVVDAALRRAVAGAQE